MINNRKDALQAGEMFYYTGKACKHGHITKRYTKDRVCCECKNSRSVEWQRKNVAKATTASKKWRNKNTNKVKEHRKIYRKKNPNAVRERHAAWQRENPDKLKVLQRKYRKANPNKMAEHSCRRAGYVKDAKPLWFEDELVNRLYKQRDTLNRIWKTNFQVDHIVPIISETVCGLHCWDNLQLLDAQLNGSKSNNYQEE